MRHTYEMIPYEDTNFLFSLGRLSYVVPHIHRELEVALVLEGNILLACGGERRMIHPGELWLMNAYQCHELYAAPEGGSSVFLELQVSASFFKQYYREIENVHLERICLNKGNLSPATLRDLTERLVSAAMDYFAGGPYYELKCAGDIDHLFAALLEAVPHAHLSEEELRQSDLRANRMRRIADYIEAHAGEKLLLTELAEREGLTLNYLSHFFAANFGIPFQTYLQHIRCRMAAALLLETEASASDVSLQCGFSALKYMNRAFTQMFGCKPSEYRARERKALPEKGGAAQMREAVPSDRPRATLSPHLSNVEALAYLNGGNF